MNNSATRLERQTLISKKKSYIQLQTNWDDSETTWYQRPAEPQCPGCPAVFSGFGRARHSCSAWNEEPTINIMGRRANLTRVLLDCDGAKPIRCLDFVVRGSLTSPLLCQSPCSSSLQLSETLDLDVPLLWNLPTTRRKMTNEPEVSGVELCDQNYKETVIILQFICELIMTAAPFSGEQPWFWSSCGCSLTHKLHSNTIHTK